MKYSVIAEDALVADDLSDIVFQCDPNAVVDIVATLDGAEHASDQTYDVIYMIVGFSVQRIMASTALRQSLSNAPFVVFVGDTVAAPPEEVKNWITIPSPFTIDSVSAVLHQITSTLHEHPPASHTQTPA